MTSTWAPAGTESGWSPPTPPAVTHESSTRTFLRTRPSGVWLLVLTGIALLIWLVSRAEAQLSIAMAAFAGVLIDARAARRSVAAISLSLHGPTDALAPGPPTPPRPRRRARRPPGSCPPPTPAGR